MGDGRVVFALAQEPNCRSEIVLVRLMASVNELIRVILDEVNVFYVVLESFRFLRRFAISFIQPSNGPQSENRFCGRTIPTTTKW